MYIEGITEYCEKKGTWCLKELTKELNNAITKIIAGYTTQPCIVESFSLDVDTDCVGFCVLTCGGEAYPKKEMVKNGKQIVNYFGTITTQPEVGDFVVYGNPRKETVRHFGILTKEFHVASKWGEGGIYIHPIHIVPEAYGRNVAFIKNIKALNSSIYLAEMTANKQS